MMVKFYAGKIINFCRTSQKKATEIAFDGFVVIEVIIIAALAQTAPFEWVCRSEGRHGE